MLEREKLDFIFSRQIESILLKYQIKEIVGIATSCRRILVSRRYLDHITSYDFSIKKNNEETRPFLRVHKTYRERNDRIKNSDDFSDNVSQKMVEFPETCGEFSLPFPDS